MSLPNYTQSNGCTEAVVKQAKCIMEKAKQAGVDVFMALLEWRNTPTESSGISPCEVMFGRCTRTLLPTAGTILNTAWSRDAKVALERSKTKQAEYYDHTAWERPALSPGQTVRVKFRDDTWQKGKILKPTSPRL